MRDVQERRAVVPALSRSGPWAARALIPAVAALVVAADQLTKTWAEDNLRQASRHVVGPVYLMLDFNSGAAFSLGTGVTPIVEAAVVVLIAGLVLFSRRASRAGSIPVAVGLGLLLGGALSNLGDRLFRHIAGQPGVVVDFIRAVSWWPIFNVADASIVVGVIVLLLSYRTRG